MTTSNSNAHPPVQPKLVTIAVPIYKRLQYIPSILKMVGEQDYPEVELLISDNGKNGSKVREMVEGHYSRPYRFRQNPETVQMVVHFNQLVNEARGEYFFLLLDDDEISPNFASELVVGMERHPTAKIGFSSQEVIDLSGKVLWRSKDPLPDVLSGPEFIRATWQRYEFGFKSLAAFFVRTQALRDIGGIIVFSGGTHDDDSMVVQMCLMGDVVLASKCVWRNRLYEESYGMSLPIGVLADATVEFFTFLRKDPIVRRYAAANPQEWAYLKDCLTQMAWKTYLYRWRDMYRGRLSYWRWLRAAFAMPLIPGYYRQASRMLLADTKKRLGQWLKPLRNSEQQAPHAS